MNNYRQNSSLGNNLLPFEVFPFMNAFSKFVDRIKLPNFVQNVAQYLSKLPTFPLIKS